VLGVHASIEYAGPLTFTHQDVPVRVERCVSALAVREAVLSHQPGQWTVVLTERTDEDLGTGLLSHLVGFRLRTPDPWAGVRDGFAAQGIDPALTTRPPTGRSPRACSRPHRRRPAGPRHQAACSPVTTRSARSPPSTWA
jgi:hypothetical protein